MKKLSLALGVLALTFMVSCKETKEEPTTEPTMEEVEIAPEATEEEATTISISEDGVEYSDENTEVEISKDGAEVKQE
ncbi:hypothetical protein ACFS5J_04755 [Flavobacterium chuncheonense]|uniref:Uncharacterized protein n=1 Tax=Flavobacterium chuncheonense TaxID=2026653 RepID=A0ABW5YJX5_9FLAO